MSRRLEPLAWAGLVAVLTAFGAALALEWAPAFPLAGADESEHLLTARRLVEQGTISFRPGDPYEYVNLNLIEGSDGAFHPKHPFGYPLALAVAYALGGPHAPFLVNPIFAVVGLVGAFLFARQLAGPGAAVLAAALLAANPLYGAYALSALSHSMALALTIWGMLLAWRWATGAGSASALGAGLLCGAAALTRYAEALLAAPLAVAVLARWIAAWRERDPAVRGPGVRSACQGTLLLLAGGAIAFAPLLVHQWLAYGSPFTSGQGITERSGVSLRYWLPNTPLTVRQLWQAGLVPITLAGVLALAGLAFRQRVLAAFLGSWMLVHLLLYHSFYWRGGDPYLGDLRYYIDLFPPLVLATVAAAAAFWPPGRSRALVLAAVFVAVVPAGAVETRSAMGLAGQVNRKALEIWRVVRQHVPEGAVVLTDEEFVSALPWVGGHRVYYDPMFHPHFLEGYTPLLQHDRPWPVSRRRIRDWVALLGGRSVEDLAEEERKLVAARLAEGRPVFFVTVGSYVADWRERLGSRFALRTLVEQPLYAEAGPEAGPRALSIFVIEAP